jgi:DNA-binding response OmpR family regulator
MDIQLPIVDGYTATRQIKSDPALRSIPIIAVTSYALREEENKARAAGCDDYVPKPFSPRQQLAKIRNFLQYPIAAPSSEVLVVSTCTRHHGGAISNRAARRRLPHEFTFGVVESQTHASLTNHSCLTPQCGQ